MTLALALMILNPTTTQAEIPIKKEPKINEWINVESTAYTAFCDTGCIGITATGIDVSNTIYYKGLHIIAVDPNIIPLYSMVEIDTGNRLIQAIALDTGGAIKGNKIDLLVEDKPTAYQWGRRQVKVRVLE